MRARIAHFMIALVTIILISNCLLAQDKVMDETEIDSLLDNVKQHYYDGEYQKAIEELEKAKEFVGRSESKNRVEAYSYLAYSYIAFGKVDEAKEAFKKALEADPELELDPAMVSPKIIGVFDEVKAELEKSAQPAPSYDKSQPDNNPRVLSSAILRSAVVPGWGQLYEDRKLAGIGTMGLWAGAIGLSVYSMLDYADKKQEYKDAAIPSEVEEKYAPYNSSLKLKNASFFILGGVWVLNILDTYIFFPEQDSYAGKEVESNWGVSYDFTNNMVYCQYRF